MELAKIRNLSDEELKHQEKTSSEQLFRLRFQVALGQNDGVKKLRQLRKEIAQIKTVARERELGIHGEIGEDEPAMPSAESKPAKTEDAADAKAAKAKKGQGRPPRLRRRRRRSLHRPPKPRPERRRRPRRAAKKKTAKAKGASK